MRNSARSGCGLPIPGSVQVEQPGLVEGAHGRGVERAGLEGPFPAKHSMTLRLCHGAGARRAPWMLWQVLLALRVLWAHLPGSNPPSSPGNAAAPGCFSAAGAQSCPCRSAQNERDGGKEKLVKLCLQKCSLAASLCPWPCTASFPLEPACSIWANRRNLCSIRCITVTKRRGRGSWCLSAARGPGCHLCHQAFLLICNFIFRCD